MENELSGFGIENELNSSCQNPDNIKISTITGPRYFDELNLTEEGKKKAISAVNDLYVLVNAENPNAGFIEMVKYFMENTSKERADNLFDMFQKSYCMAKLPGWDSINYCEVYKDIFNTKNEDDNLLNHVVLDTYVDTKIVFDPPKKSEYLEDEESIKWQYKTTGANAINNKTTQAKSIKIYDYILYNKKIRRLWFIVIAIAFGNLFESYTNSTLKFNWPVFYIVSIPILFTLFLFDEKFNKFWREINRDIKIVITTTFVLIWILTTMFFRDYIEEEFSLSSDNVVGLIHMYSYFMVIAIVALWQSNKE